MDTLFYDSKCPLCQREIRLLQRIADDELALVDLHSVEEAPGQPTRLEKLTALHLRTAEGVWLTGVDATVRSWAHTPWGWAFSILHWPLIGALADWFYRLWARRRYQALYGCAACADDDG